MPIRIRITTAPRVRTDRVFCCGRVRSACGLQPFAPAGPLARHRSATPRLVRSGAEGRLWPIAIYRDENPAWYGLMVSSYWIAWVTALAVFAFGLPESLNALPN